MVDRDSSELIERPAGLAFARNSPSRRMSPQDTELKTAAQTVLRTRLGLSADVKTLESVTRRVYEDAAGVLVPMIGDMGLKALSSRALHVVRQSYPATAAADSSSDDTLPAALNAWLRQLDRTVAIDAAAATFATLGSLLGSFIGDALTIRLLRKAWPDGFPDQKPEDIRS
jgi:hypothetical protein